MPATLRPWLEPEAGDVLVTPDGREYAVDNVVPVGRLVPDAVRVFYHYKDRAGAHRVGIGDRDTTWAGIARRELRAGGLYRRGEQEWRA